MKKRENVIIVDRKLLFIFQAPVVQTLDSAIHRINHYPADSVIDFRNTYQLDSDLSGGQRYPTFEQPGPDAYNKLSSEIGSLGQLSAIMPI